MITFYRKHSTYGNLRHGAIEELQKLLPGRTQQTIYQRAYMLRAMGLLPAACLHGPAPKRRAA